MVRKVQILQEGRERCKCWPIQGKICTQCRKMVVLCLSSFIYLSSVWFSTENSYHSKHLDILSFLNLKCHEICIFGVWLDGFCPHNHS